VREALALLELLGSPGDLASALSNLAVLLDHQDRHREAAGLHRRAADLLEAAGDQSLLTVILCNLAVCLGELGDSGGALGILQRAMVLHEAGGAEGPALLRVSLGTAHADLGEYGAALRLFEHVLARDLDPYGWLHDHVRGQLATVYTALGSFERAEPLLVQAAASAMPDAYLARVHLARARLEVARGGRPEADLARAEALLGRAPRPLSLGRVRLVQAAAETTGAALAAGLAALAFARDHDLPGLELSAHARLAQALLRSDGIEEALSHARQASRLLEACEPVDLSRGEALLAVFEAMRAARDPEATPTLARATRWFEDTLARHVPPELRDDFRTRSPLGRALREIAARQAASP
jgi:tetratricopeptide (TPR) repeat protein